MVAEGDGRVESTGSTRDLPGVLESSLSSCRMGRLSERCRARGGFEVALGLRRGKYGRIEGYWAHLRPMKRTCVMRPAASHALAPEGWVCP